MKLILNTGASPIVVSAQTVLIGVILLSFWTATRKRPLKGLTISKFYQLVYVGVLIAGAFVFGVYGLRLSTSINYGFLIKTTSVFSVLLAYIFLKEHLNRYKVGLLVILIIGAYLITTGGQLIAPRLGDLLILASALCFSISLTIQKPVSKSLGAEILGLSRILIALPVIIIVAYSFGENPFQLLPLGLIFLVGATEAVKELFVVKTLKISTASYVTMMGMITPVLTTVLGLLFLSEVLNAFQILGGVLIIGSGILIHKLKM